VAPVIQCAHFLEGGRGRGCCKPRSDIAMRCKSLTKGTVSMLSSGT
jgi:hypothetical protein